MNTADTVTTYISTQLVHGKYAIDLDTNLVESGHLDSTALLELILWVGDRFNIAIQAEDFTPENFGTPRHIVEFVEARTGGLATSQDELATEAAGGD